MSTNEPKASSTAPVNTAATSPSVPSMNKAGIKTDKVAKVVKTENNKVVKVPVKAKRKPTSQHNEQVKTKSLTIAGKKAQTAEHKEALAQKRLAKKMQITTKKAVEPIGTAMVVQIPHASVDARLLTSLETLPLTLNHGWQLVYANSPMNEGTRCMLVNEESQFNDGYKMTNLKLWLTENVMELQSASHFDLTYPDTGVYLLSKAALATEGTPASFSLTSTNQPNVLTANLNDDIQRDLFEKLVIKTGFWPTWPINKTTEVTFWFTQSKEMLTLLEKCNELQAELK